MRVFDQIHDIRLAFYVILQSTRLFLSKASFRDFLHKLRYDLQPTHMLKGIASLWSKLLPLAILSSVFLVSKLLLLCRLSKSFLHFRSKSCYQFFLLFWMEHECLELAKLLIPLQQVLNSVKITVILDRNHDAIEIVFDKFSKEFFHFVSY